MPPTSSSPACSSESNQKKTAHTRSRFWPGLRLFLGVCGLAYLILGLNAPAAFAATSDMVAGQTRTVCASKKLPPNWVVLHADINPLMCRGDIVSNLGYNQVTIAPPPMQPTRVCMSYTLGTQGLPDPHSLPLPDNEVIVSESAASIDLSPLLCGPWRWPVTIAPPQNPSTDICSGSPTPTGWRISATYSVSQRPQALYSCPLEQVPSDPNVPLQQTIVPVGS
jgi:hypothetical protein